MKQIMLVEDHQMIRDALKLYLSQNPRYTISHEAENGREALTLLRDHTFDLMITDINMPKMNGIELMENIKLNFPTLPVLVISMHDDERSIQKMVGLGAKGYILKKASQQEFLGALNCIINEKKYFSPPIEQKIKIIIEKRKKRLEPIDARLSIIEIEILRLLVKKNKPTEIAAQLQIPITTIDLLIKGIYKKTSCHGLPGLTMYAFENGYV